MKKLLVILLAVCMLFAFAACATTEEPATEDTSATDVQEDVTPEEGVVDEAAPEEGAVEEAPEVAPEEAPEEAPETEVQE